jgi:hypothetical protein
MELQINFRGTVVTHQVSPLIGGNLVVLDKASQVIAEEIGHIRYEDALRLKLRPAHGYDQSNDLGLDLQGCYSEMAVALSLRQIWHGIPARWKDDSGHAFPDVGEEIHVRSTDCCEGHLWIRPSDPDEGIFVLCIFESRSLDVMRIVGSIEAAQGKRHEYWGVPGANGRPPCFMVPQIALDEIRLIPNNT